MDTKALKDKILQLAIKGKLVPQNENDEPAYLLLEKIKEEKERLIKEKAIKKDKLLPDIREHEKLFDLPNGWEWCRLGEIFNIKSTKRVYERDYAQQGIPFYRSKEIGILSEGKNVEDNYYISNELYIELKNKYGAPKIGDLLITSVGTIGKCWICDGREFYYKDGNITQLDNNIFIDMKYINQFINSNIFLEQVGKNVNGTAYNALTIIKLKNMILPLPPLEEQKRIVAKVDSLFKLIDELDNNKQDLLQNIADARSKVLQLAIEGKLVSQDEKDESASVLLERIKEEKEQLIKDKVIRKEKPFPEITDDEKLFDLPNGWEWCRLGDIGIYKKGPFGSTITKSMFVPKSDDTVKVYEQKNAIQKDWKLGEYYITKEYFEEKLTGFEVFEGDIIVSCAGTIGETYIMPSGIEKGVINQALMKMKLFDGINVDYFLMYFDFILKETSKESSKGSAIKNIPPFDIFKKMLLPLPPLEEQKRIVAKINAIMSYFDMLEKQIN